MGGRTTKMEFPQSPATAELANACKMLENNYHNTGRLTKAEVLRVFELSAKLLGVSLSALQQASNTAPKEDAKQPQPPTLAIPKADTLSLPNYKGSCHVNVSVQLLRAALARLPRGVARPSMAFTQSLNWVLQCAGKATVSDDIYMHFLSRVVTDSYIPYGPGSVKDSLSRMLTLLWKENVAEAQDVMSSWCPFGFSKMLRNGHVMKGEPVSVSLDVSSSIQFGDRITDFFEFHQRTIGDPAPFLPVYLPDVALHFVKFVEESCVLVKAKKESGENVVLEYNVIGLALQPKTCNHFIAATKSLENDGSWRLHDDNLTHTYKSFEALQRDNLDGFVSVLLLELKEVLPTGFQEKKPLPRAEMPPAATLSSGATPSSAQQRPSSSAVESRAVTAAQPTITHNQHPSSAPHPSSSSTFSSPTSTSSQSPYSSSKHPR